MPLLQNLYILTFLVHLSADIVAWEIVANLSVQKVEIH